MATNFLHIWVCEKTSGLVASLSTSCEYAENYLPSDSHTRAYKNFNVTCFWLHRQDGFQNSDKVYLKGLGHAILGNFLWFNWWRGTLNFKLADQGSFICKIMATWQLRMIFQLFKWHIDICINWHTVNLKKRWAEVLQIYPNAIHFNPLQLCPSVSLLGFPVVCSSCSIVLSRYFDILVISMTFVISAEIAKNCVS